MNEAWVCDGGWDDDTCLYLDGGRSRNEYDGNLPLPVVGNIYDNPDIWPDPFYYGDESE